MAMIPRLLLPILLGLAAPAYAADPLDSQITQLLEQITASNCLFERNGKTHTADESVKHINRKYAHYQKEIDSIDSFIELTATKSLFTGKEYKVNCNGEEWTSADWLHRKASELGLPS